MSSPSSPWRRIVDHGGLAVLLIRHGRTVLNAERRFCGGRSDPPLDDRGREQAAALAERFGGELDALFASPQRRARETAAVLGTPTILEALRELDQGELEGREIHPALAERGEFFAAWRRDPTDVAVPGGETMGELAARVSAGMRRLVEGFDPSERGRVVGVVGHQMAQAAFLCRALDRPLRDWPSFELNNARANLVAWDGRGWSLCGRNL